MRHSRKTAFGGIAFIAVLGLIGLAQGVTNAWITGDLDHLFAGKDAAQVIPSPEGPSAVAASGTVIVGTGDPADPCTVELDASVYPQMRDLGVEDWAEACRAARN